MKEVVGLFPGRSEAEKAVDRLTLRGFDASSIGYLDRHRDESGNVITDPDYAPVEIVEDHGDAVLDDEPADTVTETGKGVAGGVIGGAAAGAGASLLASAGLLLVPGIGPFLAAGTLAGTLGAAAVGAAGGGVLGGAAGAIYGATDDDADETSVYYRDRVDSGAAMVSVSVDDVQGDTVADILRECGAERVDVHYDAGWVN